MLGCEYVSDELCSTHRCVAPDQVDAGTQRPCLRQINEACCVSHADNQHSGCQWIEGSGVSQFGERDGIKAISLEQFLDGRHDLSMLRNPFNVMATVKHVRFKFDQADNNRNEFD